MRLSVADLESLLKDQENDLVERKETEKKGDEIRQAICAFANDLPDHRRSGVIFVGVRDNGTNVGTKVTDEMLLTLAAMRDDGNIVPLPTMSVERVQLSIGEVAVVVVEPADAPPARYKGRVWIQVGPRRAIASAQDERILNEKRRYRDLPFDLHPISFATLADLNLGFFRDTYLPAAIASDVLAQNGRSLDQQLASVRCVTIDDPPVPTVLGGLLAAKDVGYLIPGAYVQFLRIAGTQLTDAVADRLEIYATVPELLRRIEEKLESHNRLSVDFTSASVERRHALYPRVALEQLMRNAILHRNYEGTRSPIRVTWYDDRLEILSPGGPYGRVTLQNIGQPGINDYRNPYLAEAMANLGFVQKFGVGISLAQGELRKNGNPPAEFDKSNESHILVILRPPT